MKRLELTSAVAVLVCLALASAIMGYEPNASTSVPPPTQMSSSLRYATLPGGTQGLVDASGHVVPLRRYERIVGGSIVARAALGHVCEKERIAAVVGAGIDDAPDAFRYSELPVLNSLRDTEKLLSLDVDLVILNSLTSIAHIQRLRDAGIEVFALGPMRGVDTFARDLRQVATLVGDPQRGDRIASGFVRRIRNVASDISKDERKKGMYLSAYGTQIFGGTTGTSYHDVLEYGGLVDAAAAAFEGWPQYTAEHVLAVDPQYIVAAPGVAKLICNRGSLAALKACANNHAGFVELPASWLEDPSMVMLDVAEGIREAVYGPRN